MEVFDCTMQSPEIISSLQAKANSHKNILVKFL